MAHTSYELCINKILLLLTGFAGFRGLFLSKFPDETLKTQSAFGRGNNLVFSLKANRDHLLSSGKQMKISSLSC